MKINLDESLCVGHGRCDGVLPTVSEVNDDGVVTVHDDAIAAADPAEIRAAVEACPSAALAIEE